MTFAVVEWIDVFTRRQYADVVVDSLNYCQKEKGLEIDAWCLMSNHLHLIISSSKGELSDVLRDFKKFTASKILKSIENNVQESRRAWMLWIFKSAGAKNSNNKIYQFWRQSNQPKELETNKFKDEKLNYIHMNPVEAGVVNEAEHYRYSSAIDYSGGKGLVEVCFL
ncbi:REP-associated tyrosine transposase [Reichenbachiella agariperforans]|uniref:REP-associated tyrosine transposase n=1 Tax=Reichenbachiella agariperforans TaxID=156994 RepID=UPI00338FA838